MLTKTAAANKDRTNATADVMQHRHFAVVAGIIAKLPASQRDEVARHFASQLADTNSKFNRTRFLDACQPRPENACQPD